MRVVGYRSYREIPFQLGTCDGNGYYIGQPEIKGFTKDITMELKLDIFNPICSTLGSHRTVSIKCEI